MLHHIFHTALLAASAVLFLSLGARAAVIPTDETVTTTNKYTGSDFLEITSGAKVSIEASQDYTGGTTVTNGTLKGTIPQGLASSAYTPFGSGTVSIAEGSKLIWTTTATGQTGGNSGADLTNAITGAGTLRLEMGKTYGHSNFGVNSKVSDFTGTLELANFTRFSINGTNAGFNKIGTIVVESGAQFWPAGSTMTFCNDFVLNGTGAGAGGDGADRGAMRIESDLTFTGNISLGSNAMLGISSVAYIQNDLTLNDHTLRVGLAHAGSANSLTISGNVSSGTLQNDNANASNPVTLKIATSSDVTYAKDQVISAAIKQNNTTTAMEISPAEDRTITTNGVISGSGAVTKTGAGKWLIGAVNTFNGKLTISEGTVEVPAGTNQTSTTYSRQYVAGQGALEVAEGAQFIWNNQYSNDSILFSSFAGAGTITINAAHNTSSNYGGDYGLSNAKLVNYTGTLELTGKARMSISGGLGGTTNVSIASGSMVWAKGGTYSQNFFISGNGSGAGGDGTGRGAIGITGTNTFTGTITLEENSEFGLRDTDPIANLQGTIETNGYTLSLAQNHQAGGKINLTGNVQSTGGTLGKLNFWNRGNGNTYSVTIGDSTAATEATKQTIAANINITGTNPTTFTFLTGKNRTIEITGQLTGSHDIVKTGAGTLNILGGAPISGKLSVEGGSVTIGPLSGTSATNSGLTSLTVTDGATVNLNTPNKSLTSLTVTNGTVNANFGFVDYNVGPCLSSSCQITVGSEDGGVGYLKLAKKALGDHGANVTIYDGSTIEMAGGDISFANSSTVTFYGNASITSSGTGSYFNFRGNGNQTFKVVGADAHALIDSQIYLYDGGFGSVNVEEASSSLTINKNVTNGQTNNIGFHKIGAGTLILKGENKYPKLQIDAGTVELAGNATLRTSTSNYPLTVSVADGATLVLSSAENLSNAGTFTMAKGATLLVNNSNWTLSDQVKNALGEGTTLGGSGTINGDLTKTGLTISPGDDSVGTLTINGNLTLSGSNVLIDVEGESSSDVLKVTGTADLGDSVFVLTGTEDQTPLEYGDSIKFLETSDSTTVPKVDFSGVKFDYKDGRIGLKYEDGGWKFVALDAATVPEPATWLLLLVGAAMLAAVRMKK